jgi:hypothetical protein
MQQRKSAIGCWYILDIENTCTSDSDRDCMISALRNPGLSGSVLVGLTFCAASAMAEQYAWQLDGGVHRADTAGSAEIDTTFVTATGYFPPIDDSDGPLALAPFLSRSSRVSATVAGIEEDYLVTASGPIGGQPIVSTGGNDSRMYSASGRYVWRNSGWYAGGGLRSFSIDHPVSGSLDIDNDRDGYALSAGKYLAPSTALELEFGSTTSETSILAPLCRRGRSARIPEYRCMQARTPTSANMVPWPSWKRVKSLRLTSIITRLPGNFFRRVDSE